MKKNSTNMLLSLLIEQEDSLRAQDNLPVVFIMPIV